MKLVDGESTVQAIQALRIAASDSRLMAEFDSEDLGEWMRDVKLTGCRYTQRSAPLLGVDGCTNRVTEARVGRPRSVGSTVHAANTQWRSLGRPGAVVLNSQMVRGLFHFAA